MNSLMATMMEAAINPNHILLTGDEQLIDLDTQSPEWIQERIEKAKAKRIRKQILREQNNLKSSGKSLTVAS